MKNLPAALGAIVGGLLLGSLATVFHSVWFPLGTIVVCVVVALFLGSLRLVSETRFFAGLAAVSVVAAVAMMAGNDGEGSVLVMGNVVGFVFLGAITVVVTIVLAWPKVSPRKTGYDEVPSVSERNTHS